MFYSARLDEAYADYVANPVQRTLTIGHIEIAPLKVFIALTGL
jgi:hypothetical protein